MSPQPDMPTMADSPVNLDSQTLDQLFPAEPASATASQTPNPPVVQPQTPPAVQPPAADEFLKGTRSVYKTREAAVEGLNSKDALIEQLRQQYMLSTGVDPITRQPVGTAPAQVDNYIANPKKYVDDLKNARSESELASIQQKFILDTIQPMAPAITQATRQAATRQVESELPEFHTFYGSQAYRDSLDRLPALKEAVEAAEGDVRFHSRLPELYKIVYLTNQGVQLPELLKRQTPATQTQTPTRTTNVPTTPSLPASATTQAAPTLSTKSGRQAIIEQFETGGGLTKLL